VVPPDDSPPDAARPPTASSHATRSRKNPADPQVRRALARLAAGAARSDDDGGGPPGGGRYDRDRPAHSPAAVVATAEDAATSLADAAAFRADGGLGRLRRAVDLATAADERDVARRGQRVLAAFERVEQAVAGRQSRDDATADADANHFHRGRGTPMGPAVEGRDE
jgi:hypothetical protein